MEQETLIELRGVMLELLNEFVRICSENNLTYFLTAGTLLGAVRHKGFIPWDDDIDVAMPRIDYEKFLDIYGKKENTHYYLVSNRCSDTSIHHYSVFAKFCKKGTVFAETGKDPESYTGIWLDIWPYDNCIRFFLLPQVKLISFARQAYSLRNNRYIAQTKIKKQIIRLAFLIFTKRMLFILIHTLFTLFNKLKTHHISFLSGACYYKRETFKYNWIFPLTKLEFEGIPYCVPGNWDTYLTHFYGNYMNLPPVELQVNHNPKYIIFNDTGKIN